ncbi:FHA domain-containing protein [Dolichospermum compactum]|uniref:FHA domain-containing protein n=1 Tax=Dolichospermum compactum TaxID=136073 RepID=UPI001E483477|nr:FHA domain-containing protein [Dolichospermum compactum]
MSCRYKYGVKIDFILSILKSCTSTWLSKHINPPEIRIRDLGSLNGTYINNTKIGGK